MLGLALEIKVKNNNKILNKIINMTLLKLTHQQQETIRQQYKYRYLSSTQIQKIPQS